MAKSNGNDPGVQETLFDLGEEPTREVTKTASQKNTTGRVAKGGAKEPKRAAQLPVTGIQDTEEPVPTAAADDAVQNPQADAGGETTEASGVRGANGATAGGPKGNAANGSSGEATPSAAPEQGNEADPGPRMKRLVYSGKVRFKELDDGTRLELSEEEWRGELAHHFRRDTASSD